MEALDLTLAQIIYNFLLFSVFAYVIHINLTPKYGWKTYLILYGVICFILMTYFFIIKNLSLRYIIMLTVIPTTIWVLYEDSFLWEFVICLLSSCGLLLPEALFAAVCYYGFGMSVSAILQTKWLSSCILVILDILVYIPIFLAIKQLRKIRGRLHRYVLLLITLYIIVAIILPTLCLAILTNTVILFVLFILNILCFLLLLFVMKLYVREEKMKTKELMLQDYYSDVLLEYDKINEEQVRELRHDFINYVQTLLILKKDKEEGEF